MVAINRRGMGLQDTPVVSARGPAVSEREFSALVAEHAPYVWRVLRSLGVREDDLEDVSQEAFLVVHRRLHTFEGRASLRTWICGIALRVAANYRGKAHRKKELVTAEPPERNAPPTQESELERRRAAALLDTLLASLSAEARQVFVLFEIEQLSMREVAEAVGCPLTTAYSRYYVARDAVQAACVSHDQGGGQ
jgi:RNA polymerase sigma-70 factor (ECF subfamily)